MDASGQDTYKGGKQPDLEIENEVYNNQKRKIMDKTHNSPVEGRTQAEHINCKENETKRLERKLKDAERLIKELRRDYSFQLDRYNDLEDEFDRLQEAMEEREKSYGAFTRSFTHPNALQAISDTTKPLTVSESTREAVRLLALLHEFRESYLRNAERLGFGDEALSAFENRYLPMLNTVRAMIFESITLHLPKAAADGI